MTTTAEPKQELKPTKPSLKKELGLWSLVAPGVGGIIGSGVFGLPATMGSVAGPSLVLAVVFVGLITMLLAMIYAALGSAFPVTGGPYSIPRLALGDAGGFVIGWRYFLYAFTGTAAIIDIMVTYAAFYVPGLSVGLTLTDTGIVIAVAATVVFTAINVLGVKWGASSQSSPRSRSSFPSSSSGLRGWRSYALPTSRRSCHSAGAG